MRGKQGLPASTAIKGGGAAATTRVVIRQCLVTEVFALLEHQSSATAVLRTASLDMFQNFDLPRP